MPRLRVPLLLNPRLESAAVGSTAAAVYAAARMLWNVYVDHTDVFDMDVLVAAVVAVYGLYVRAKATPVADPRDADGRPLVSAGEHR
ncbi:hypothetical protein [Thermomonospora cellulosilytica]|uniref:Uncharacterized protein n=1 Tax=Thermomonospora cellulosilytica TaxID=1411118 RepID=A0A7W3MUU0_9ACTN|nr:hypothetical protein [Thermomonospora cellulosilytica]MBA9002259.1 hypothetical protein [Thermomonospora cellulosilytica]